MTHPKKHLRILTFKTLRMTIAIPVIIFFLVATLSATAIVFRGSNLAIENVIQQLEQSATQVVDKELDTLFGNAEKLILQHQLSFQRQLTHFGDNKETQKYFSATLQAMPYALMTYVALPDGQFYGARRMADGSIEVVKNNAGTGGNSHYFTTNDQGEALKETNVYQNFDPRTRPWYIEATQFESLVFTDMYSHFVLKEPTITASLPVYDNNKNLQAVFAVDFLTTWLTQTLQTLPIGDHGHIIIVDDKNQLVSSTTGEPLFKLIDNTSYNLSLKESQHPVTRHIATLSPSTGVSPATEVKSNLRTTIEIDNQRYFISQSHYGNYGFKWRIFTIISSQDYLEGMNQALSQSAIALLIMAAVSIALTFRITQSIVRPIKRLDQAAQSLLGGSFSQVPEEARADEIGTLTSNFNIMGRRLMDQVVHLESQVRERTLELEQKNELLKNLAETDALTGLPNRRRFMDFANRTLDLAARNRKPLAIIMMDIDHFKAYNDTYGHIAGDHVLERIAQVMKQIIRRKADIIARYGGEEFAAVLQDLSEDQAKALCESLRQGVEAMDIEHSGSDYATITISIGLYFGTIYPHQKIVDLIDIADQALYTAKSNGRNRVEYLPGSQ